MRIWIKRCWDVSGTSTTFRAIWRQSLPTNALIGMNECPMLRSSPSIAREVAAGTSFIRTHVDIDNEIGLANLEGVLETRRILAQQVDIEIVAFSAKRYFAKPWQ